MTAEALAAGPFHGFFPEGATLFRLDPPCVTNSTEVTHVIVTALPEYNGWGAETTVVACDHTGQVDSALFRITGPLAELYGVSDPYAALKRLGYGQ